MKEVIGKKVKVTCYSWGNPGEEVINHESDASST
jgi:hypothetical protein